MRHPLVRPFALATLTGALLASVSTHAGAHPGTEPHPHPHQDAVVLDAEGAVVTAPDVAPTRTLGSVQGCRALLTSGRGDCTVVRTANGPLVVTVEPGRPIDDVLASRPWSVNVYRPSHAVPDGWDLALTTRPELGEAGPLYAAVTARAADVTGDGADELVLGYRHEGTGAILDLDVIGTDGDGSPRVLVHDDLYKGSAVLRDGKLVTFTPVYRRADANCCPTWIARDVLRYDDGEFRVDRIERVRTKLADVPPSELG